MKSNNWLNDGLAYSAGALSASRLASTLNHEKYKSILSNIPRSLLIASHGVVHTSNAETYGDGLFV
jgi:hypothetical protein